MFTLSLITHWGHTAFNTFLLTWPLLRSIVTDLDSSTGSDNSKIIYVGRFSFHYKYILPMKKLPKSSVVSSPISRIGKFLDLRAIRTDV
jgi:hypothetical protein